MPAAMKARGTSPAIYWRNECFDFFLTSAMFSTMERAIGTHMITSSS